MGISTDRTYTGLQASVADFLNRQDLTATIPDFVVLAETEFFRRLRIQDMVNQNTSFALSDEYPFLPNLFREAKRLVIPGYPPLEYLTPERLSEKKWEFGSGSTGRPTYYTILSNVFQVTRTPDQTYLAELTYFSQFPALSQFGVNWLLSNHPDVYLYGTLVHSAPYLKDDDRIPVWKAMYEKALAEVQAEDDRMVLSGATLKMQPRKAIG